MVFNFHINVFSIFLVVCVVVRLVVLGVVSCVGEPRLAKALRSATGQPLVTRWPLLSLASLASQGPLLSWPTHLQSDGLSVAIRAGARIGAGVGEEDPQLISSAQILGLLLMWNPILVGR